MKETLKRAALTADLLEIVKQSREVNEIQGRFKCLCMFHDEKTPSFTLYKKDKWRFKCFGCGEKGDAVDYIKKLHGVTQSQAVNMILEKNIGKMIDDFRSKEKKVNTIHPELDWKSLVNNITDFDLKKLSKWRGYSIGFCWWLRKRGLIGMYDGAFCFPIQQGGRVVRVHCRPATGKDWFYYPRRGAATDALIVGSGKIAHIFESQWDQLAAMDYCSYNRKPFDCWIATRGASNAHKLEPIAGKFDRHYLYQQGDKAAEKWTFDIVKQLARCIVIHAPDGFKDTNDFIKAGGKFRVGG
jgi:hypothetical protein